MHPTTESETAPQQNTSADRVLAIASHVVFGYVGNSVTTFVLQSMGLEVSALNTVQFSNHTGYGQWTGYRTTAEQIMELWEGLKNSELVDEYGMLLTGYVPGADGVESVGRVAKELRAMKKNEGGNLFWVLDPVMGDEGKLYVSSEVVPVYKSLIPHADLITPNQFETELLTGITVDSVSSLSSAVDALHRLYGIPHIVITSVTFGSSSNNKMFCAGSSITSTGHSRKFKIDVPVIGGIFVGTGDMFAALTLARFREESDRAGLLGGKSWLSDDTVLPLNLPLARAVEKVLSSMQSVLQRTKEKREIRLAALEPAAEDGKVKQTVLMKASELQLVQGQNDLRVPKDDFHAEPLETVVMN